MLAALQEVDSGITRVNFIARNHEHGGQMQFAAAVDAIVYAKIVPKLRGDDSPRFSSFHDQHGVGVIVAGPRSLEGLRRVLQFVLSAQGTFAACEPLHC
jgi:hypothetical protein